MPITTLERSLNLILASLPAADADFLSSISRSDRPSQGRALTSRFAPTNELWFPHAGAIALFTSDATGRTVQTGLIGREGVVGVEALLGLMSPSLDTAVQIEGPMSVVPADALRPVLPERPAIQSALLRSLHMFSTNSLQTIACNRLHSLMSRCCRWLLTLQDRAERDELPLTQENLATLLGSGRPRINALLANLEEAGLVRRYRGRIRLLTRSGLKAHACGCYDATQVRQPELSPGA
jgi:CRP-like cAMP-binding protein